MKIQIKFIFLLSLMLFGNLSSRGQVIEAMTFNVRYDNPEDGINRWAKRKEGMVALFNTSVAALVLVTNLPNALSVCAPSAPAFAIAFANEYICFTANAEITIVIVDFNCLNPLIASEAS
jgi:hypothetical protein